MNHAGAPIPAPMHSAVPGATNLSRRAVLGSMGALPFLSGPASAAQRTRFTYKLATGQDPSHPVNRRSIEAADRIREATHGALDIQVFPSNQLGSDLDLLTQLRIGAIDFFIEAASILSVLVPAAGIVNTGFAFLSYDSVWRAMDGPLGQHLATEIEKVGLLALPPFWDNGFRQITSSAARKITSPADLKGFRIRVPSAAILTSLFQSLGAAPTPINFNELYTALQTGLVQGEENALPIVATAKLEEVQRYCTLTSHVWDAYILLASPPSLRRLPSAMQDIVLREFARAAGEERADIARMSTSLRGTLAARGMQFIEPDKREFRVAVARSGFYDRWRTRFGKTPWRLLEDATGALS